MQLEVFKIKHIHVCAHQITSEQVPIHHTCFGVGRCAVTHRASRQPSKNVLTRCGARVGHGSTACADLFFGSCRTQVSLGFSTSGNYVPTTPPKRGTFVTAVSNIRSDVRSTIHTPTHFQISYLSIVPPLFNGSRL